jgi:diguanylate cyclase (GGDEF)-like protein/PAS domain S-box-containing protein
MGSFGSSNEHGSRPTNLFPQRRRRLWAGFLLATCIILAVGGIVYFPFVSNIFLLGLFPAVMLAFFFGRLVYFGSIGLIAGVAAGVSFARGESWSSILEALLGLVLAVVLSEMIHRLALEQRRTEEMQILDQERMKRLSNLSQDGLALINSKGQIAGWNRAMEEITGMKREMVQGRFYWDMAYRMLPDELRNPVVYETLKGEFKDLFEKGQALSSRQVNEKEIVHPKGIHRTIQEIIFPMSSSQGGAFGMIFHDFSDYRSRERNLQDGNDMLMRSVYELQDLNKESSLINEMGDQLQGCPDMATAFRIVSEFGERIFPGQSGCLFVFNENVNLFERRGIWGQPAGELDSFGMEGCWAIKNGRAHVVTDTKIGPNCHHLDFPGEGYENLPYVCIPMIAHGETIGILHVQARSGMGLDRLEQLAGRTSLRIAMVLPNLRLKEILSVQAIRDPLTGLFNRHYMEVTFERELRRAIRDQNSLGVIMMGIDHFKHFGELHGPELSETILKEVGAFLQSNVRGEDIVCRMGEEEFVVILPRAALEITNRRAEQFRKGIADLRIAHIGLKIGPISVSAGAAGYPEHGTSPEEIFKAVDGALRRSQSQGCDQVVVADF